MLGSRLAFALELRKAGSFNDTFFSLFPRAASSNTESNKKFVKDIVGFIFKKSGSGVAFGFFSEAAFEKVPALNVEEGPFLAWPPCEGVFLCCDAVVFLYW